VFDAMVIGVPDDRWGERVTAVVQLRPAKHVTLDELNEHARSHIAGYKVPRELHIVEQIMRQPTGKPDYRWAKTFAMEASTQGVSS
jgi:acyl-CoA synthetase (AMP-forming)/AMP-acid ligase II